METVNHCPICHTSTLRKVFNKQWKESSFNKCSKCNLIFQNPQESKSKTNTRYSTDYFNYEHTNQINFFNLIQKTLNDYKITSMLPNNSNILEIGSATGLFLKYMKELGHNPTGLEICKESAEYGIKHYNVKILQQRLEETNFSSNSFDFIHFSHLIEHVNDPITFLSIIHKIIKPTGFILLTTPNSSGLFSKFYSENWRCIVDDHLFLFNKFNLEYLLDKLKFSIIDIKTWGSIPSNSKLRFLKPLSDSFVKKTNLGDVISILFKKGK